MGLRSGASSGGRGAEPLLLGLPVPPCPRAAPGARMLPRLCRCQRCACRRGYPTKSGVDGVGCIIDKSLFYLCSLAVEHSAAF